MRIGQITPIVASRRSVWSSTLEGANPHHRCVTQGCAGCGNRRGGPARSRPDRVSEELGATIDLHSALAGLDDYGLAGLSAGAVPRSKHPM